MVVVHHDLGTVRASFDWALLLNVRAVVCGPVDEALASEAVRMAYGASSVPDAELEEQRWAG
jgi:manganese/zinc/iron transport system ATP- binding protein